MHNQVWLLTVLYVNVLVLQILSKDKQNIVTVRVIFNGSLKKSCAMEIWLNIITLNWLTMIRSFVHIKKNYCCFLLSVYLLILFTLKLEQ